MDKPQLQKQGKEIVTMKDITMNKYDVIVTTLESLTESTERAAASWDSTGALEALGGQIAISIEEMGKYVTENLCRALAETMREVLVVVLKSKEPAPEDSPMEAKGATEGTTVAKPPGAAAVREVMVQGGAMGSRAGGSSGASAAAVARPPGAAVGREAAAQGNATGGGAGAAVTHPLGPAGAERVGPWGRGWPGSVRRRRGVGCAGVQWAGSAACSNGPGDRGGPREEEGGRV
ncbi:unnamed protein product [Linum trigynum]|uniref:Uncharacterized protein n=1 Tax=Linum trigynum TaxID=586398 RepID=A0AAV2EPT8_9ROSI